MIVPFNDLSRIHKPLVNDSLKVFKEIINEDNSFKKKEGFTIPIYNWIPKKSKQLEEILPKSDILRYFFTKDEIIELMKSSNIGTYSSLSLIILITIKITALTSLFDQQVIDREEFRDILVQGEVLPSANKAKSE